jgi:hypothetical protein
MLSAFSTVGTLCRRFLAFVPSVHGYMKLLVVVGRKPRKTSHSTR